MLLRTVMALVGLGVLYVGVTFVQVWQATGGDEARKVDAIVVLGAAQYNGTPSPVLASRLDHALELYEQGWADHIVTTGSKQEGDRVTEGFAGYEYLLERGVPDEALLVVTDGTNTYESLRATARVLAARSMSDVLLVSDPYHSLRLSQTADEVGLRASVSPTDASTSFGDLVRETGAVSVGRIIGFRLLASWT